jgi:hypothetical protein
MSTTPRKKEAAAVRDGSATVVSQEDSALDVEHVGWVILVLYVSHLESRHAAGLHLDM